MKVCNLLLCLPQQIRIHIGCKFQPYLIAWNTNQHAFSTPVLTATNSDPYRMQISTILDSLEYQSKCIFVPHLYKSQYNNMIVHR